MALALMLGSAVASLSWYWRWVWLPPSVWEDVAVAMGLRPPQAPFPLLWHTLAGQMFRWLDPERSIRLLLMAGHCALGVAAVLLFMILDGLLPKVFRGRMQRMGWSRWIVRMLLIQGVLLFVCSDPVWEAGQVFGPTMMHLLMLLLAVLIFLRSAWAKGVISAWYWTMALLGMLGAETPLGVILAIACLVVCHLRAESNADKWTNPLADPFVRTVTMRRMTLAAAAGWLVVMVGNTAFFYFSDGMVAHDMTGFLYTVSYLYQYLKVLGSAATPAGWMLFAIVVLVPLVLSMIHVGAATDDDKFLPYRYAAFFTLTGIVSFLQLAGWRSFWFWTWTGEQEAVRSHLMRCLCSLLNALRTWLRLKPARMDGVALQLGFELWRRSSTPPPKCAGMVARPNGFPEGLAEVGARASRELADRFFAIYNEDDELDKRNTAFKKIRQQLEMLGHGGSRLTPREGLKLGMDRADFRMAEMFARQVLVSDPDDLAANFVMGMFYFGNGQYGRAEVYLSKCLGQRPDEWTILNNLAVAQLRQGMLAEAEENARHAVRSNPDSREAKRTLENVLKAKAEKEKNLKEQGLR